MFLYSPTVALYGSGHPDFNIFYLGGGLWLHHQNPYVLTPTAPFVYPPPSILFFGLYALLSVDVAGQAWMATYFMMFIGALLALAMTMERERRSLFVSIATLLFFTSYPLLIMMVLGQSDLFVSSLSMLSFAALRFKRVTVSVVLLSAAMLMKGPAVMLLIYFVVYRRDFRFFLRFIAAVSGIVLASLLAIPIQLYYSYFAIVAPMMSITSSAEMNQSIIRYVSLSGMSNLSSVVALVGVGLFAVFAFYVSSKSLNVFRKSGLRDEAIFLMNVLVMLVLGPRSWPATYVWAILPIALFLSALLVEHVKTPYLASVGIAAFLLGASLTQEFLIYSTLPLAVTGNLILILLLIPICIRPSLFLQSRKSP
jgi:hypothetical protein